MLLLASQTEAMWDRDPEQCVSYDEWKKEDSNIPLESNANMYAFYNWLLDFTNCNVTTTAAPTTTTATLLPTTSPIEWECEDYDHIKCQAGTSEEHCIVGRLECDGISHCPDAADEHFDRCPPVSIEIEPVDIKTTQFTFKYYPDEANLEISLYDSGIAVSQNTISCIHLGDHAVSHWKQCTVTEALSSTKYLMEATYAELEPAALLLSTAAFQFGLALHTC